MWATLRIGHRDDSKGGGAVAAAQGSGVRRAEPLFPLVGCFLKVDLSGGVVMAQRFLDFGQRLSDWHVLGIFHVAFFALFKPNGGAQSIAAVSKSPWQSSHSS